MGIPAPRARALVAGQDRYAMLLDAVMAACWWTGTTSRGARPARNTGPAAAPSGGHDAKGPTP